MDNKCRFCGADKHPRWDYYWECGTNFDAGIIEETGDECKIRQIAQLTERLEAWRNIKENLQGALNMEIDLDRDNPYFDITIMRRDADKLKALGEIE